MMKFEFGLGFEFFTRVFERRNQTVGRISSMQKLTKKIEVVFMVKNLKLKLNLETNSR